METYENKFRRLLVCNIFPKLSKQILFLNSKILLLEEHPDSYYAEHSIMLIIIGYSFRSTSSVIACSAATIAETLQKSNSVRIRRIAEIRTRAAIVALRLLSHCARRANVPLLHE
jgi:hypothetical protein